MLTEKGERFRFFKVSLIPIYFCTFAQKVNMNYSAVLFDFDYTLADSSRGIVICFRNVLERNGYSDITDDRIKRTIGKPLEDSFSILTGVTDTSQLVSLRKEYVVEADVYMNSNTFLFPDTLKVVETLRQKQIKIGIVSTKYSYRIRNYLYEYAPETQFDIIIGGEDVACHKPDPQGVLMAMERLNVNKGDVLYVGDSVVDAETAQNAGVDFAGITSGATTKEELASYPNVGVFERLGEILDI